VGYEIGDLGIGAFAVLFQTTFYWLTRVFSSRHVARWKPVMEAQGLKDVHVVSRLRVLREVVGFDGPRRVRLVPEPAAGSPIVRVIVDSPRESQAPLTLWPRPTEGDTAMRTGDALFDAQWAVDGSSALVYACLDRAMRARLLMLHGGAGAQIVLAGGELRAELHGKVVDGKFRAEIPGERRAAAATPVTSALDREGGVLTLLLEIARGLPGTLRATDVVARLAHNAREDPLPQVRIANVDLLAREFSARPQTHETLLGACTDPNPGVRLHAAQALGEERIDVLWALVEDPSVDDTCAAGAVYALGARVALDRALGILEHALRTRRFGTVHACLERLGECGEAAVATLAKVLAIEDGELGVHAARALARSASPGAEGPLVAALARDAAIRLAAAVALGECGTPSAVWPLREAEQKHAEAAFQRAARQAIAEIQARASGASPGQLSLAAGEAGQLSFPDRKVGQVSLVEPAPTAEKA
jgi:hypothetical protein